MESRIKAVRKYFDLIQKDFGERIGLKANTITSYETGVRVPSDAVIKAICREYGVDEEWLRTGKGTMFRLSSESELIDRAISEVLTSDDDLIKGILLAYWELSGPKKAVIREIVQNAADHIKRMQEEKEDK